MKIDNNFIKKNEWIIRLVLKRIHCIVDDDLLQEARIWLMEAAKKWDKNKSSWNGYAYSYILWSYMNNMRNTLSWKKRNPELNGYRNVCLDKITDNDLYKVIDENFEHASQKNIFYDSVMDRIEKPSHREMVKLRTQGYLYKDIGFIFNISRQRVQQICENEYKKIRKDLEENE